MRNVVTFCWKWVSLTCRTWKESSQKLELAQCCPEQWEADQKQREGHTGQRSSKQRLNGTLKQTDKRDVINNVGEFQTKNKHILWKQKLYYLKQKERLCLINTLDSVNLKHIQTVVLLILHYSFQTEQSLQVWLTMLFLVASPRRPPKVMTGTCRHIEEEDGGQALQAKRVPHIAPVKWSFPLNVLHQSTKYPVMKEETKENPIRTYKRNQIWS